VQERKSHEESWKNKKNCQVISASYRRSRYSGVRIACWNHGTLLCSNGKWETA